MSERPRILDLFCGAGGATKGYQRAGFHVTGVDIVPQPNYCGDEFVQMDALEAFDHFGWGEFDAIHASPPCQSETNASNRWRGKGGLADQRPDLLTPTLGLLRPMSDPWVVENVMGARMNPTLLLHGGMFGLGVHRPRYFESNILILAPKERAAVGTIGVYGERPDGRRLSNHTTQLAASSLEEAQEAMGMDWADWHGTKEAIPPAYTEFIGTQLMAHIKAKPESLDLGER